MTDRGGSWLDPFGVPIEKDGVILPARRKIKLGNGISAIDNPDNDSIDIDAVGGGGAVSPEWVVGHTYFGTGGEWVDQGRLYNLAEQAIENGAMFHLLSLPDGVILTEIEVWLKGAGGHGDLPDLPYARLYRGSPNNTASYTVLGTAEDSSSDVTSYQQHHAMVLTELSEVIDNTQYRYLIELFGEQGAEFVAGLQYLGTRVTFT